MHQGMIQTCERLKASVTPQEREQCGRVQRVDRTKERIRNTSINGAKRGCFENAVFTLCELRILYRTPSLDTPCLRWYFASLTVFDL